MNPDSPEPVVVFVSAPDPETARSLVRSSLGTRLAACANILPKMESHYWWEGKLEQATECLILFKTTAHRFDDLQAHLLKQHPYDVPEVIALPITSGSDAYLGWIESETIPASNPSMNH